MTTICQLFIFRSYTEIPIIPNSGILTNNETFKSSHFQIQHVSRDFVGSFPIFPWDVRRVSLESTVTRLMLDLSVLLVQELPPQLNKEAPVSHSVT